MKTLHKFKIAGFLPTTLKFGYCVMHFYSFSLPTNRYMKIQPLPLYLFNVLCGKVDLLYSLRNIIALYTV